MDELTGRMFKVLEIPESASITEIEAKYRELVRKCQAAQSSDDPVSRQEAWLKLKEVSSAYEIVKKYWSERNIPPQGPASCRRPGSALPGTAAGRKRSAVSTVIVIGLVCIAIVYYGHGFMKKQNPPRRAEIAQSEVRLFMTSR